MAADWIGIDSSHLDSFCGESAGAKLGDALDGSDYWEHTSNHTHYFILDLGVIVNVQQVRGRSLRLNDPIDVNIYVSDDTENWGAAVATNITTWQDTDTWVEIDVTDKDGRYVIVEIIDTEHALKSLNFGKVGGMTIFDVYGEVAATIVEPTILALALTLESPSFQVEADIIIVPNVLILELDHPTPTPNFDYLIIPSTLALELDQPIPEYFTGTIITPAVLALELDHLVPTLSFDYLIIPSTLVLELDHLIPTISTIATIIPSVLSLLLTLESPAAAVNLVIIEPDVLALEVDLLLARMGTFFPILSTSPRIEGYVDEYPDETVIRDFYESGYPVVNPQFTLDLKSFLHSLKYVSNADKLIVMAFYLSNRDDNFFWTNEQDDDTVYEVIFVRRPNCVLDGAKDEWKIDLELKQVNA